MFQCPECVKLFSTALEIKNHLKYIHAFGHLNFHSIVCHDIPCPTEINTWGGLWVHLKAFQGGGSIAEIEEQGADLEEEQVRQSSSISGATSVSQFPENLELLSDISTEVGITIFTDLLHDLCSCLLASGINNSIGDLVIKEMRYSFSEIFKLICKIGFKLNWIGLDCTNDFEAFSCQVNSLLAASCKVKSAYQRLKVCKKYHQIILPVEISLGSRTETRIRNH